MKEPPSLAPYATPEALLRVENRARDDRVSLEQSLLRDIQFLREATHEQVRVVRELYDQRFVMLSDALQLQAKEYERRLDTLNHAHQAALEAQARTVPREMFDQYRGSQETALLALGKEQQRAIEAVKSEESAYRQRTDERIATLEKSETAISARDKGGKEMAGMIRAAIGFTILIGGFLLGYIIPLLRK